MKKKNRRLFKCYFCGKQDKTVKRKVDPYDADVNNKTIMRYMCDRCEQDRRDDI